MDPAYERLLKAFSDYERAADERFDRLTFRLHEHKSIAGATFKIVLTDQLGHDWLFKGGKYDAADGAVAVHRVHNLFGLDDPETHYKTLVLNGVSMSGTIQRFYATRPAAPGPGLRVSPDGAEYMARSHVLDWLTANNSVHAGQFIDAVGEAGEPSGLMRIDNSVNWYLMDTDRIDIDYYNPMLHAMGDAGYLFFWRSYLHRNFDLPLAKIHEWAQFIAAFPDDAYLAIFQRGIDNQLELFPNNRYALQDTVYWVMPEIALSRPQKTSFVPKLLKRKKSLGEDLARVYLGVTKLRQLPLELRSTPDLGSVSAALVARLESRREHVKAELAALSGKPAEPQGPLQLPISLEAFDVIRDLAVIRGPQKDRETFAAAEPALRAIEAKTTDPVQRASVRTALANLHDLLALQELRNAGFISNIDLRELELASNRYFDPNWTGLHDALERARVKEKLKHKKR